MPLLMYPDHNRSDPLDRLTEEAGQATEPPSLPQGGIPRQWLPAWIRWPLRAFFLPFVYLDLGSQWVARKLIRPPFKKMGQCYQRGNCCYYVLIPAPRGLLGRLFYFWSTQINGFYPRQNASVYSEGQEMRVMGCRYLQKDGRCGQYRLRPTICRQWPVIEYFGRPRILKGCGYWAEGSSKEE